MTPRVLIAAGGTGGHVYPAIAIADALKTLRPDIDLLFVGTRDHMEWTTVPKAGYDIASVWISGFHRRPTLRNVLFPIKLLVSGLQSLSILSRFRPDVVVSCGGYAAGPIGWVAFRLGVPVVVQEQNSFPGVTNRMLGRKAARVYTAYPEAAAYFRGRDIRLLGNPVRSRLAVADRSQAMASYGFDPNRKTLLVMGGSGGAQRINESMVANLHALHQDLDLNILWQCGKRYHSDMMSAVDVALYPRLRLIPYIDSMPEAYAAADLVVSRSGAGSIAELTVTGKPVVLVPSPHVAGDHQTHNARSVADAGAAVLLSDATLVRDLVPVVGRLMSDDTVLTSMAAASRSLARAHAARDIATDILSLIAS